MLIQAQQVLGKCRVLTWTFFPWCTLIYAYKSHINQCASRKKGSHKNTAWYFCFIFYWKLIISFPIDSHLENIILLTWLCLFVKWLVRHQPDINSHTKQKKKDQLVYSSSKRTVICFPPTVMKIVKYIYVLFWRLC